MRRVLTWLDENLLFLITAFLLAFIPLFPKLPLFDVIPGYIVRVRTEDFLVGISLIIWIIQLWRKKISFGPNPLAKPILAYLTVGVLSMISAVFIIPTVPLEGLHIGKMVLHFLRRVEYFSLFFVFYSTVKSLKQLQVYFWVILFTVLGVTIYGYGQKYLFWPAFSTMNREFAKGWMLYLTQHARVLSTFGGHYDLAAYVMIVLTLLWAFFFSVQKIWQKIVIFLVLAGTFWLLILTASRTSFLAYIAGVTILFFFWMFTKGIPWAGKRWLGVVILSIVVMLLFGDLSDRFLKLLKLDQRVGNIRLLLTQPFGRPPEGSEVAFLENNLEAVTSKSDFPPLPIRPTDVTEDIPQGLEATKSATGTAVIRTVQRTYSKTALMYDLSTGIRLDALWPRAIKGFMKNPLLGSGYSTLTKTQFNEFTEAESTDNDFLRALGETGILGFLAFGWIIGTILVIIFRSYTKVSDPVLFAFLVGFAGAIIGLLVNAVYIDVFEASKVAFSFWAFTGIVLGGIKVWRPKMEEKVILSIPNFHETMASAKKIITNTVMSYKTHLAIFVILAFLVRQYRIHSPLADWHSWRQADTSAVTRNFVRYGIDVFYPRYDDLSSVASGKPNPEGYRFVEFPLYNIFAVIVDKLFPGYTVEYSGRLTSIFASLGTLVFLSLLVKKYIGNRVSLLTAFFFAVLPYNIYWSRVILPEPMLTMLTMGMLFWFDKWVETDKKRYWIFAVLFGTCGLLVKFTAIFFVIPMFYLAWRKWKWDIFKNSWIYLFAGLMLVPFFAWRLHISRFPEGIPAFMWLFNGNGIRFKGAWFWWLFAERIAKLILGGWGIGLLIIGLIREVKDIGKTKGQWLFHFWGLGMLMYLIVFATGNVQHDYYQIILVPILCVFLARGADLLILGTIGIFHPWLSRVILTVSIIFMLMFGWYQARDFFNINHPEIVEAGQEFERRVSNTKVRVIAPYGGDSAFLYQTGRRGWPLVEGTVDDMIKKGAHYFVSVTFDQLTNEIISIALDIEQGKDTLHSYKIIDLTDKFVIIQLVPDKMLPQS